MTLQEMVARMDKLKRMHDISDQRTKQLYNQWDEMRKRIVPEMMEEMGIDQVRYPGIGTVATAADAYVGIREDKQHDAYEWIEEQGLGNIIGPYIHHSTLKATLKKLSYKGVTLPEEIFKFEPYTYVKIVNRTSK